MYGHNDPGAALAYTGAGIAVGGTVVEQSTLLIIAFGLVIVGSLLVRVGFRRGKTPLDV